MIRSLCKTAMLGSLLLLGACEVDIGKDEAASDEAARNGAGEGNAAGADWQDGGGAANPAAGKAEEGRFSINAPGFDLKFNLPGQISANARDESGLLYPGARLNGLHIEAETREAGRSGVELRFTSGDPPERIASWYQDAARTEFSITSAGREGASHVLAGTQKEDGDSFRVVLSPRSGGGTDGRLSIADRG
jgi:hypothetical protein